MSSYIKLQSQIQKLQRQAEAVRKRELSETIARIKEAIKAFNLTAEDLGLAGGTSKRGRKAKKSASETRIKKRPGRPAGSGLGASKGRKTAKAGKKRKARGSNKSDGRSIVAPKYRDPATGASWTGRGKQPRWLAQAISGGKKLEDFRI